MGIEMGRVSDHANRSASASGNGNGGGGGVGMGVRRWSVGRRGLVRRWGVVGGVVDWGSVRVEGAGIVVVVGLEGRDRKAEVVGIGMRGEAVVARSRRRAERGAVVREGSRALMVVRCLRGGMAQVVFDLLAEEEDMDAGLHFVVVPGADIAEEGNSVVLHRRNCCSGCSILVLPYLRKKEDILERFWYII